MDIYEDERTVSRADLAAWLRQVASQVEAGQVFYGAAGTIAVADQVHCELEIEQEGKDEYSIEIEFSWKNPVVEAEKPKADAEKTDAEKAAATEADEEPETESSATA
ncbi:MULTISPECIES: amphi-Trp domain-containing protein [unclassified Micromonospora]|uniref:amphi-Trp domain-containing protein n=1 Tax=unclassified Micromonospora TaxID=2617518 RepID=UPI001033B9C4|nr:MULTISPECIES: amphi-Trp domain-containing protein [unclassified Micromonospora]QKW15041.1 amphi-Trp domain-containing protein [Verrucosispora sp. NA02020]TBL31711.1 amphi-Trp domain-containing protein [Verrucosispora sp. SN26_14.1]